MEWYAFSFTKGTGHAQNFNEYVRAQEVMHTNESSFRAIPPTLLGSPNTSILKPIELGDQ
jgi:hypothetical protein